jgi:hypothetical protein
VSKFRLIEAEKGNHPISRMCELLEVSSSGFHAWCRRPPSDRQLSDAWLLAQIRQIHHRTAACMALRASTLSCGWVTVSGWGASAWSG